MAVKSCVVKDENYYKVLKALNYDENRLTAILLAYEKIRANDANANPDEPISLPSYDELVAAKLIDPHATDKFSPIFRLYYNTKDELLKLSHILSDEIRKINKELKSPNITEDVRKELLDKKKRLSIELGNTKLRIENVNRSLSSLGNIKSEYSKKRGELMNQLATSTANFEEELSAFDNKFFGTYISTLHDMALRDFKFIESILGQEKVDAAMMVVINNILTSWRNFAGTTSNTIFTTEELSELNPTSLAFLNDILRQADFLRERFNLISREIIVRETETVLGEQTAHAVGNIMRDIDSASATLLSLAEYDNPISTYIWYLGKQASIDSQRQIEEAFEKIDKLNETLKKYSQKELKQLFLQDSTQGDYKLPKLRAIFTQRWFGIQKILTTNINRAVQNNSITHVKKYTKEFLRNTYVINPLSVFDESGNIKDNEAAKQVLELLNEFEPYIRQRFLKEMKQKALKIYEDIEVMKGTVEEMYNDEGQRKAEFDKWAQYNHPQAQIEFLKNPTQSAIDNKFRFNPYAVQLIPRRTYTTGKSTEFYDSKFHEITQNPDLLEAYQELESLLIELRSYLPRNMGEGITFNSIPYITMGLVDEMMNSGLSNVLPKFWQKLLSDVTISTENNIVSYNSVSPDGTITPKVSVKNIRYYENMVEDYVLKKLQSFLLAKNLPLTTIDLYKEQKLDSLNNPNLVKEIQEFIKKAREEASKELVDSMNFDLANILKVYSAAVLTYRAKTKIEAKAIAMRNYLASAAELETTPAGTPKVTTRGTPITKAHGLTNLLEAVDYHIRVMFGHEKADPEWITKKKVKTEEEKELESVIDEKIKQLDEEFARGEINEQDYLVQRVALSEEKYSLGRNISGANIVDLVNSYIRLKGLGWNAIAPIANINVAFFANMMEASREKYLTPNDLRRGYTLFFSDRAKVKNLFKKLGALQTVQNEIYAKIGTSNTGILHPMYLTESAEFFNQAPLVVGFFLNTEIEVNGEKMSLYDAFDEDGNLKYPESSIKFTAQKDQKVKFSLVLAKARADWLIQRVHGNYDPESPIKANSKVLYRSLLVFRKWIINSFYNRIQGEQHQWVMNDIEKGRWRSYGAFFNEYGFFGGILTMTLATTKALLFSKEKFGRLNELDAANMRANIKELVFLAYLTLIAALLYGMMKADDDDEEKPDKLIYALTFTVNILGRLTRDITLYADAEQFQSMLRDPVPIWGLTVDITQAIHNTFTLIEGKPEELSDKQWENKVDRIIKHYRSFLPYGFNTIEKATTYATSKNMYNR